MNMQKYYDQLVGAKIVGFKFVEDDFDGEAFPVFTLQLGKQKVEFTLSMDEEGNGAGFAFIERAS
jgi:hypothetical protein